MTTPAPMTSVDELLAAFAADAARRGPMLPLTALIARLRDPPRDAAFWGDVGDAMIRSGFAEPAVALLGAGLRQHPRNAQLHYLRGNALRVSRRLDEAETDFRTALALAPGHRQASLSLAYMLREQGRIDAAALVVVALGRAHAGDTDLALALLEFLRDSGAHAQARTLAELAHAHSPTHARLAAIAGELALAFGAFDAARTRLGEALQRDPTQGPAWLRLSYCGRCTGPDDAALMRLRAAWANAQLPLAARACAGFGVAKLLDDLDDYAGAAAILREANALAKSQSAWNADAWFALGERQISQRLLPALEAVAGFVPVFIVGLPRTGSTLVATRLARHAQVHDRGELNWIAAMYEHLAAQNALADRAALQSVAALIGTQMRRDDAPARCYIDKNPLNFRYLNLILALFPNARIVHCRRGARDTALSLWSQHFAHPDLGFSYDLPDIAGVARDEQRLMAHWRALLPSAILDVDYEVLVSEPVAQLARIARFVGVPEAAAAGLPAATADEVITTASVWQARQPVHTQAVGRWRHYAEFVPELAQLFPEAGLSAEG
jgi:tetratricopeptide (TPR) repeat protein